MKKKSFTIDRSPWRCGGDASWETDAIRGAGLTMMLNDEGFKCCLGHIASQCGFSDEQLLSLAEPYEVVEPNSELSTGFLTKINSKDGGFVENTKLAEDAMGINDDCKLSDEQRESKLAKLFQKAGYSLSFVGEYTVVEE